METGIETVNQTSTEMATFGAGCFWQVEAAFQELPGVIETAVGYEGGDVDNPTYEQVCTGTTGHVEVCQVTFDPSKVEYADLVSKYLEIHDPTQLNRQGPDVGYQYRSVIFAHSDEQAETAQGVIERAQERFRDPIMTTVEPAKPFWRAEEYHQCYIQKRSSSGLMGMLLGR
ncbi:MAG: peptide-methionine (S)-S-oxide reductase MsrA [Actinomycetota bacterium]